MNHRSADWATGKAFYQAGTATYRVTHDAVGAATFATFADVSPPLTRLTALDRVRPDR